MKKIRRPEMLGRKRESGIWNDVLVIVCALLLALLFFEIWFSREYYVVEISGTSMMGTLNDGDLLYARRNAEAEHGDIIVIDVTDYEAFRGSPHDSDGRFRIIKRVIGTAGDVVRCRNGVVSVKYAGESEFTALDEPYVLGVTSSFPETEVGEGEIFFLGDNRSVSKDSRVAGCCYTKDVTGVVPDWSVSWKGLIKGWESFRSLFGGRTQIKE